MCIRDSSSLISSAKHSKDLVQGPVRALRAALDRLGWTMVSVCKIRDQQNACFDLTASSPAMLMHYAKEAYLKYQMDMATLHLVQKQRYPKETDFRWRPVVHYLRKRKCLGPEAGTLMQLICRTFPTPQWLNQHGWQTGPLCECQQNGDLQHLIDGSVSYTHLTLPTIYSV